MGYLTHEWEALALKKKSHLELTQELCYLYEQLTNRHCLFMGTIRTQFVTPSAKINLPARILIEDLQLLDEQFQRVIEEINRRKI